MAVNQHVYYPQQYGEAFQDLTSYMQKLQQQGLIQPIDHNSQPFVLPHNSYGYVYPSYPTYQVAHEQENMATAPAQGSYYYQPNYIPNISLDYYGKHKVNHNENLSSHGTIGHNVNDKKPIIKHLNATIQKVSDKIEHKVNAIKVYVEKSVHDINKLGDDVYQQVGDKATKIFDSINKKLEKIEHQLHYARTDDGNINLDELDFEDDDEENIEDTSRSLLDEDELNTVVDSETVNDEMRTDIRGSLSNALKKAQDNFNKLIEAKVTAVNAKIAAVNSRVESVFNKLQVTLEKLKLRKPTVDHDEATTPEPFAHEEYTTIQWKPKTTAWPHQTQPDVSTPAYYQYTVPPNDFFYNSFKSNDEDGAEMKRMDANVEDLEMTDSSAEPKINEAVKSIEDEVVDAERSDDKDSEFSKIIKEAAANSNDQEIKNDDDLQTKIVENVKDTLNSDDTPAMIASESDLVDTAETETVENQIDEQEKSIESIVAEELRTDSDKLSKLDDEKINNAETADELRNLPDEQDENAEEELEDDDEEEEEPASVYDDYVKSSGNDENDDDENDDNVAHDTEINEMRSIDNEKKNVDNEEIPSYTPSVDDEEKVD